MSCSADGFAKARVSSDVVPRDVSLPRFLYDRSSRFEDRIAVIDDETGSQCTYRGLWVIIGRLGAGLRAKGVRKGDRVCIVAPNCFEYPAIVHAIASLGGVLVPLNPLYTPGEIVYYLRDSEPKFIICSADIFENVLQASSLYGRTQEIFVIGGSETGYSSYEDLLRLGDDEVNDPERIMVPLDPVSDLMSVLYSSGTTGLPKGCMITHYNFIANIVQFSVSDCPVFTVGDDVTVTTSPMFHMYGMALYLAEGLANGCTLVIMSRFQVEKYAKLVEKYRATTMIVVPPVLAAIADSESVSDRQLRSVRRIVSSAVPLPQSIVRKLVDKISNETTIMEHYGATEFFTCTSGRVSAQSSHRGCIGQKMPFVQIKIVDVETGLTVGPNQTGEILATGPSLMVGYWRKPDSTRSSFDDEGYFRSGDLGFYDEKEALHVIDRLKDVMKYKGYQVNPTELEFLLLTHPSVREVAVVGKPHENDGELPTAFVVTGKEMETRDMVSLGRNITEFIAAKVSPWKKLRGGIRIVKSLPKTASGKVLKNQLRRILEQEKDHHQPPFQKSSL